MSGPHKDPASMRDATLKTAILWGPFGLLGLGLVALGLFQWRLALYGLAAVALIAALYLGLGGMMSAMSRKNTPEDRP